MSVSYANASRRAWTPLGMLRLPCDTGLLKRTCSFYSRRITLSTAFALYDSRSDVVRTAFHVDLHRVKRDIRTVDNTNDAAVRQHGDLL